MQVVGATTFGSTVGITGSLTAASASFTTIHGTGNSQFDGNVILGNATSDVTTVTGDLTGSRGAYFAKRVGIGTDATMEAQLHIRTPSPTILIRATDGEKAMIRFHHANEADS